MPYKDRRQFGYLTLRKRNGNNVLTKIYSQFFAT